MYLLRRYFGLEPHQVQHELPVWWVDLLLDELEAEQRAAAPGDDEPPDTRVLTLTTDPT